MKVENVYNLNAENKSINKELDLLSIKIEKNIEFYYSGTIKMDTIEAELNDAFKIQKHNVQKFQDNKKKYKLLQKYGYVLEDIKKLLQLASIDVEELSFEKIIEKIEELSKGRTNTAELVSYSTIQNLFTESTHDLLEIEESFQNGALSSSSALEKVNKVKNNLDSHIHEIPYTLRRSYDELDYLISLYQGAFVDENKKNSGKNLVDINLHEVSTYNQVKLTELNTKTRDFSKEINTLFQDISKFEPQVNLDDVYKKLKSTNSLFKEDNWNYNTASEQVADLTTTTTKSINKQTQKNNERESYKRKMDSISTQMSDTTKKYTDELTIYNMKESNSRTQKANENVEKIKELSTGSCAMPEDIAKQFGNLMTAQLEDDEYLNSKNKTSTKVPEIYNGNIESTVDNITDMQNYVDSLEQNKILKLNPNEEHPKK